MKALISACLATLLAACVVYNDGEDTGIITPIGAASTASPEDGENP